MIFVQMGLHSNGFGDSVKTRAGPLAHWLSFSSELVGSDANTLGERQLNPILSSPFSLRNHSPTRHYGIFRTRETSICYCSSHQVLFFSWKRGDAVSCAKARPVCALLQRHRKTASEPLGWLSDLSIAQTWSSPGLPRASTSGLGCL